MSQLEIAELAGGADELEWQSYVERAPNASIYHRIEWRNILHRSFGHRCWYLVAREGRATRGVLPMVEMQSSIFGHFIVSLPFLNYGGILADTAEHETALAGAALGLARKRGARRVEFRQPFEALSLNGPDWILRKHKAALVVKIDTDFETHWSGLSSRLRGKLRKAAKAGASFVTGGHELLDDFYRVFSLNMRDLGTPVHSPAFFQNVLSLSQDARVLVVRLAGKPVAAAIAVGRGSRVELPWICSNYGYSNDHVNEYLYWNAILWASASGIRELDLGRSSIDAGTYRFKLQWNPVVRPLSWYYGLASDAELHELSPGNPKYALAIKCWKKLPVALANRMGPAIVRNIP